MDSPLPLDNFGINMVVSSQSHLNFPSSTRAPFDEQEVMLQLHQRADDLSQYQQYLEHQAASSSNYTNYALSLLGQLPVHRSLSNGTLTHDMRSASNRLNALLSHENQESLAGINYQNRQNDRITTTSRSTDHKWRRKTDTNDRRRIMHTIYSILQRMRPDIDKSSLMLKHMARQLEHHLYMSAQSKDQYVDLSTLMPRLRQLVANRGRTTSSV